MWKINTYNACSNFNELCKNFRATVKACITTAKFFVMSSPYAQNGYITLICILYNSQFSSTSKCLGTNVAFVKRVHCITIIIRILIIISSVNILIIIITMIIAKETALAFIFEVFIIYRLVILKFPDFSLNSKIP